MNWGKDAVKKKMQKLNQKKCLWYFLLIYGVLMQFILVDFMGEIGNHFVKEEYVLKDKMILDAAVMIGIMLSVVLSGIIRRKIAKTLEGQFILGEKEQNQCVLLLSIAAMFWVEWIVAGVTLILLPVWFLLWGITEWQQRIAVRTRIQQNGVMKDYVRQYTMQLPTIHLCSLASMERVVFAQVLKQKRERLGTRILQGILSAARRMGNGFIYLVMGSVLCLLVYEEEMEIGDALLFLFLLNAMMTSLNAIVGRKTQNLGTVRRENNETK